MTNGKYRNVTSAVSIWLWRRLPHSDTPVSGKLVTVEILYQESKVFVGGNVDPASSSVRFSTVWGFPIPRSAIVSILFLLVVTLSSPFSPSGLPEGICVLPPTTHNAANQASAYRTRATIPVASEGAEKIFF